MSIRPFRYSGNKARLLHFYRSPPQGTKRIVEPYLGSGAYTLSHALPGLGYEVNEDVVSMWKWLQVATANELLDLSTSVEHAKETAPDGKPDVRSLGLSRGQETYVRVNVSGVLTGQLTSWKVYPQHRLPVKQTIAALPRVKDVEVVHGPASQYRPEDGDFLFVDPPYVGTTGGYVEKGRGAKSHEKSYDPQETKALVADAKGPVLITYGDGASEIFPEYSWQVVTRRKVPNVRRGGTVDRTEWAAYVNWRGNNA